MVRVVSRLEPHPLPPTLATRCGRIGRAAGAESGAHDARTDRTERLQKRRRITGRSSRCTSQSDTGCQPAGNLCDSPTESRRASAGGNRTESPQLHSRVVGIAESTYDTRAGRSASVRRDSGTLLQYRHTGGSRSTTRRHAQQRSVCVACTTTPTATLSFRKTHVQATADKLRRRPVYNSCTCQIDHGQQHGIPPCWRVGLQRHNQCGGLRVCRPHRQKWRGSSQPPAITNRQQSHARERQPRLNNSRPNHLASELLAGLWPRFRRHGLNPSRKVRPPGLNSKRCVARCVGRFRRSPDCVSPLVFQVGTTGFEPATF